MSLKADATLNDERESYHITGAPIVAKPKEYTPRPLVYVAGPLTTGDPFLNVRNAVMWAEVLWHAGYDALVPHLGAFWHMHYHHTYEEWMRLDFNYLLRCDALYRLPGESPGSDREVAFAKERGIPVFEDMDTLVKEFPFNKACCK